MLSRGLLSLSERPKGPQTVVTALEALAYVVARSNEGERWLAVTLWAKLIGDHRRTPDCFSSHTMTPIVDGPHGVPFATYCTPSQTICAWTPRREASFARFAAVEWQIAIGSMMMVFIVGPLSFDALTTLFPSRGREWPTRIDVAPRHARGHGLARLGSN
jgi:hypothetical protein